MEFGAETSRPAPEDIRWALEGPLQGRSPDRSPDAEDADAGGRHRLLCARCRAPVTSRQARQMAICQV